MQLLKEKRNRRAIYEKNKELTGGKRLTRSDTTKNKTGKKLINVNEVLHKWSQYIDKLFEDDTREIPVATKIDGPKILRSEVCKPCKR